MAEQVQSGPQQSRARRYSGAAYRTLDGEDRSERITTGRKEGLRSGFFAHYKAGIPKFLQTFIIDEINDIAEAGCSRGEVFMTVVDETGVYRSPVAEVKTFL